MNGKVLFWRRLCPDRNSRESHISLLLTRLYAKYSKIRNAQENRERPYCLSAYCIVAGVLQGNEVQVEEIPHDQPTRYGAQINVDGSVQFSVFSPDASKVSLLLYDDAAAKEPKHVIPMQKKGSDWRVRIRGSGIGDGLLYMYRAEGPRDVSKEDQFGLMFNHVYPLSDPYAYDTQDVTFSRLFSSTPFVNANTSPYAGGERASFTIIRRIHPQGTSKVKPEDLIVYELHVQDYTARIPSLDGRSAEPISDWRPPA